VAAVKKRNVEFGDAHGGAVLLQVMSGSARVGESLPSGRMLDACDDVVENVMSRKIEGVLSALLRAS
jgi:hypothetical protein